MGVRIQMVLIIGLVSLFSCREKGQHQKSESDSDTTRLGLSRTQFQRERLDIDIKLLEGVWWLNENDPSALFYIYGDTLSYIEDQSHPYFIEVKNDTMVWIKNEGESLFRVSKLNKDSLVFQDLETGVETTVFHKKK